MQAFARRRHLLLLSVALGAVWLGCSETAGPGAWAGEYQTAIRIDVDGVWEASGTLVITNDSSVVYNGTPIVGAVFWGDSLAWEVAAGNASSALLAFKDSDERGTYWMSPVGECFTGWIQYPGADRLDFRGLRH